MKDFLYKKENNLFQSLNWLAFQEEYGRATVDLGGATGIVLELPLGKKAVWIQKGPAQFSGFDFRVSGLPKGTVFLRIEPQEVGKKELKESNLRVVTKESLFSGQASPKATRVLDISRNEEEILAQMKSKTRYNIRLAQKKGVSIKRLDNEDILYDLLVATSRKGGGYFPHEKLYYTKLIKDLAKNDIAHIFVAEHDGDFLAAILVSFFGEVATYLYGGQADKKKNLMAPYLCQWEAIRYAKSRGFKYYDFWGVAETDDPCDPWFGITRFKEGFGGQKVVFPGTYDYVLDKFWYNSLTFLAKLKHLIFR